MRKIWIVLVLALILTACGQEPVFEEIRDVQPVLAPQPGTVEMELPQEAALLTMSSDAGQLYFCDGYTLTVQTLAGGDLNRSLQTLTGFGWDQLTLMETQKNGIRRVECVWTAAGEGGDQIGRLLLLDDGNFHYAVTVMAEASVARELRLLWNTVLDSVSLNRTDS